MSNLQVFGMVASNVAFIVVGFLIGQLQERSGWNKLIQRGVIPAPRGRQ